MVSTGFVGPMAARLSILPGGPDGVTSKTTQ
jgi:hypothetical protein